MDTHRKYARARFVTDITQNINIFYPGEAFKQFDVKQKESYTDELTGGAIPNAKVLSDTLEFKLIRSRDSGMSL